MYFKRAHRVETQQNIELMTFRVTWSANIFEFIIQQMRNTIAEYGHDA